jgi:hypothetical protein
MGALVVAALLAIIASAASPLLSRLDAAALILLVAAFVYGMHRVAVYAEGRGWIYYRQRHGSWGAVGAAMSHVHAIYEPGRIHVQRLKEDVRVPQQPVVSPSSSARTAQR